MRLKLTKILGSPSGWEKGFQGLAQTILLMTAIVAAMFFSFWVFGIGPFSSGKSAEALNSICNQEVKKLDTQASGNSESENYSSSVTSVLNRLQNSGNTAINTGQTQTNP